MLALEINAALLAPHHLLLSRLPSAVSYLRGGVRGLPAELVCQLALKVVGAFDSHQQLLYQARQLRSLCPKLV